MEQQQITVDGASIVIKRGTMDAETYVFGSEREARVRAETMREALTWIGTPFRNCADVKGRAGGIDCAMLAVRSLIHSGRLEPFDPRPYSPHWFMHRSEEKLLGWIESKLGPRIETPQLGDLVVWQFGRCFSHVGILINPREVMHAYAVAGCALISRLSEDSLRYVSMGSVNFARPQRFYDMWGL